MEEGANVSEHAYVGLGAVVAGKTEIEQFAWIEKDAIVLNSTIGTDAKVRSNAVVVDSSVRNGRRSVTTRHCAGGSRHQCLDWRGC